MMNGGWMVHGISVVDGSLGRFKDCRVGDCLG